MNTLIQKLVATPGPSGFEHQIRDLIRSEVEAFADDLQVDALGNLIVRRGTRGPHGLRLMLSAHMDEIGVMVTHIDEHGFAHFTALGAVLPGRCPGLQVRFMNGVRGVIAVEPTKAKNRTLSINDLFIDLGASSREACPVNIGEAAAFERPLSELGKRLAGHALDNRVGVAVLIETLRQVQSPHELYFVFSAQEEVGVRGATTAAYGLEPDIGLTIDMTFSSDVPHGNKATLHLGQGPAIKVRDAKMLADPRIVNWIAATADKAKIPYQTEIAARGSNEARAIQVSRTGVPAGGLAIPCRYVHSVSEVVDDQDVRDTVRLLTLLLNNPITLPDR